MVLNGEDRSAKQIVTVSNSEEKVLTHTKPQHPTVKLYSPHRGSIAVILYSHFTYACFILYWGFVYLLKQIKGGGTSNAKSGSEDETLLPLKQ